MDSFPDDVIDVTERLAEALPGFIPDWSRARFYLVSGRAPWPTAIRPTPAHGGLAAGTLRRVGEYVERELANPITLHDLASLAGLSDCHFARAFKQSVGMPPHRYLMTRRVERAKALIQATDRPLAEIALEVGCCDQSHFSRLIVRATGRTPRALRRARPGSGDEDALSGVVAWNRQAYSAAGA